MPSHKSDSTVTGLYNVGVMDYLLGPHSPKHQSRMDTESRFGSENRMVERGRFLKANALVV
jgi:hypothetical protein